MYHASPRNYKTIIKPVMDYSLDVEYIRVNRNRIYALLMCFELFHVPYSIFTDKKDIYLIEHYNGSAKAQFNKMGYLYKIKPQKGSIINNVFTWFPKGEIYIRHDVKIIEKERMNIYNEIIDSGVIIVPYKMYYKFIMNHIPKKSISLNKYSKYLYHGSNIDIKDPFLKPHSSIAMEKKPLIYASSIQTDAMTFFDGQRDPYLIGWWYANGYVCIIERHKNIFNKMYRHTGYLYILPKEEPFKVAYKPHYTSPKSVKYIKKIKYPNGAEALKDRPDFILIPYSDFLTWIKKLR